MGIFSGGLYSESRVAKSFIFLRETKVFDTAKWHQENITNVMLFAMFWSSFCKKYPKHSINDRFYKGFAIAFRCVAKACFPQGK